MGSTLPGRSSLTDALRLACSEAGITQEQLAEQLGVHQTTVSSWLVGKAQAPLRHLPAIDALCGKPKGYILRLAGYVSDDLDIEALLAVDPAFPDPEDRAMVLRFYKHMRNAAALG